MNVLNPDYVHTDLVSTQKEVSSAHVVMDTELTLQSKAVKVNRLLLRLSIKGTMLTLVVFVQLLRTGRLYAVFIA